MSIREQLVVINSTVNRRKRLRFLRESLEEKSLSSVLLIVSLIFITISVYTITSQILVFSNSSLEKLIMEISWRYVNPTDEPIILKEYTIKKGDTLYSISKNIGASISTLVSLNRLSSQSLLPGKKLLFSEKDVVRHTGSKFSVFDVGRKYKVHPYEVFVANGYRLTFENECLVPGVQLSWNQIREILGIGFLKPLLGRFTSGFGYRRHPILKVRKFHSGLDISAPYGSKVKASMSGIVQKTGYDEDGYGYYIVIKHQDNTKTLYGHLSEILVNEGQKVSRGQVIGKVGTTGMTTGPHLHFEVIKNNRKVNPRKYIIR
ncbi:MAG: M23 family metallopeptidase [Brevinematia bacterium]